MLHTLTGRMRAVVLAVLLPTAALSTSPEAGEALPSCTAFRAESRSVAALLFAPRVELQAMRFPISGDFNNPYPITGSQAQLRVALTYSLVDLARARSILNTADYECVRLVAEDQLQELLREAPAYGSASALRKQIAILEAAKPRATELVREAERRFARQLVTVQEVDQVRLRRLRFESGLIDIRHQLALAESQAPQSELEASVPETLAHYERASMNEESERSFLRKVSAWQFDVRGGATPYPQPDWFGMVALSYNVGRLWQGSAEAEALEARRANLTQGHRELRGKIENFLQGMERSVALLEQELVEIDAQLAIYREQESREFPESERLRQIQALAELDRVELEARRAYVGELLKRRSALARGRP